VSSSHLDTQVSGHHRDHQIYRGQTDSQDANLLISCDTTVDVGPTEGTIGSLGAPFQPIKHDKTHHSWCLDHFSGPLLGPLGRFLQ
jgi:hypothetical protein